MVHGGVRPRRHADFLGEVVDDVRRDPDAAEGAECLVTMVPVEDHMVASLDEDREL
jgi:hypothetical protein